MSIEIGSLIVRGTFGSGRRGTEDKAAIEARLELMRAQLREEMREMIEDAERRAREEGR